MFYQTNNCEETVELINIIYLNTKNESIFWLIVNAYNEDKEIKKNLTPVDIK